MLSRKFSPIHKNESYFVEEDFLDRANVDVIKGEIKSIDLNHNIIRIKGHKDQVPFDRILIAWGANKKRILNANSNAYSNVYYIEDRQAHARVHLRSLLECGEHSRVLGLVGQCRHADCPH